MPDFYSVLNRKALTQGLAAILILLLLIISSIALLLLDWGQTRKDDVYFLIFAALIAAWAFVFLTVWFFRLLRFQKSAIIALRVNELGIQDNTAKLPRNIPWTEIKYIEWKNYVGLRLIPTRPTLHYKLLTLIGLRPHVFPRQYLWLNREVFILFMEKHLPDKYRA